MEASTTAGDMAADWGWPQQQQQQQQRQQQHMER
jgi:hypothetical protein